MKRGIHKEKRVLEYEFRYQNPYYGVVECFGVPRLWALLQPERRFLVVEKNLLTGQWTRTTDYLLTEREARRSFQSHCGSMRKIKGFVWV